MYLLRPSPELWTVALPHRTQILYAPDMAFVALKLNLSPGAAVIEAGTGSGSFTHTLARTVGCGPPIADQIASVWKGEADRPAKSSGGGRVWSFEFHKERVERAEAEFAAHGLDRTVMLAHRNVCRDGFGLENEADALFLDLPAPWEAIPYAPAALKKGETTRVCCFSPCIEQVLRTVTALSENGFTDIATYESLVRTHESLTNVGQLENIGSVIERIRTNEHKREARHEMQIAQSRAERARRAAKADADAASGIVSDIAPNASEPAPLPPADDASLKRKAENKDESASKRTYRSATEDEPAAEMLYTPGFRKKAERKPVDLANVYSRPYPQMRGHTSYLTFAVLLPRS